jgi:hypothetical protein
MDPDVTQLRLLAAYKLKEYHESIHILARSLA